MHYAVNRMTIFGKKCVCFVILRAEYQEYQEYQ